MGKGGESYKCWETRLFLLVCRDFIKNHQCRRTQALGHLNCPRTIFIVDILNITFLLLSLALSPQCTKHGAFHSSSKPEATGRTKSTTIIEGCLSNALNFPLNHKGISRRTISNWNKGAIFFFKLTVLSSADFWLVIVALVGSLCLLLFSTSWGVEGKLQCIESISHACTWYLCENQGLWTLLATSTYNRFNIFKKNSLILRYIATYHSNL